MKRETGVKQLLTWLLILFLAAPPAAMGQDAGGASQSTFTEEQLTQMLAPIALYPDSLLSQILMASTYPLEVVQACRWANQNQDLKGDALAKALEEQPWDPSVKSLVNFPQVLDMMNEKLDWTGKLGDAFLAQPKEVMGAVQKLRAKAEAEGNLKTTPEQKVVVEKETQTIIIESASPEVIYVPAYNPTVVYGAWPYPAYPPYPYYPPGYVAGAAAFSFVAGVAVGAAWGYAWGGCNWHGGNVDIDVNRNANINRNINRGNYSQQLGARGQGGQGTWQHNPQHRQGVAYRDQGTSQRFGQSQARSAENMQAARGYGDRGSVGSREGGQGRDLGSSGGMGSRESLGQSGSRERTGGGDRSAFSGSGSGRSEQMASQRGSMSRGSSGGSFGGGGGRGGGGGGRGGGGGGRR
jgi:hypothetical protein